MSDKKHTPEPFGYFKAEPFGWTDCAETDDGAVPLYERNDIETLMKQRDELLTAIREVLDDAEDCLDADEWAAMLVSLEAFHNLDTAYDAAVVSVKGGA